MAFTFWSLVPVAWVLGPIDVVHIDLHVKLKLVYRMF